MAWRVITEDGVAAPFGLAADETLARRAGSAASPPTLRLYTYRSHAALVGRFQNAHHELDVSFCRERGVAINRRPTGGGAILMGNGQLGVALAVPRRARPERARELMSLFSSGIVEALKRFGVRGSFEGKNDIEIRGRKVAGLGIHRSASGGLLFHASLLVEMDIPFMLRVLETPFEKIADKGVDSVEARITTLDREMRTSLSLEEVREELARGYGEALGETLEPGAFSEDELEDIEALEVEKYRTEAWVFQTHDVPDRAGSSRVKTPSGLMDVEVRLAGSTIKAIHIGGDFFAPEGAVSALEASLRWRPSHRVSVREALFQVYAQKPEELEEIPFDALTHAIDEAVRLAREPYGCFVTPKASHA